MTRIEQPAEIAKAEIAVYAAMRGKTNTSDIVLGDKRYRPGEVKFVDFAGVYKDGKYRGVYRFELGKFDDCDKADLNQLPPNKPLKASHARPSTVKEETDGN